eukprot:CAMPEP_0178418632 /NCGR_PEP_ID=MMETSP0689_2-20121128/25190_1 /TAXON_ID=160604 /ORGANISM="Amphidinium massartii, Strain CS-259" /LENGTH=416 /DNA_ID=CAMNT_0020040035 /DNA_START=59 /DNA_END=1307 /DNA_ORIENTATION=+
MPSLRYGRLLSWLLWASSSFSTVDGREAFLALTQSANDTQVQEAELETLTNLQGESCNAHGACDTCLALPDGATSSPCFWCGQDQRCRSLGSEDKCQGADTVINTTSSCPAPPQKQTAVNLTTAERMARYSYCAYYDDPTWAMCSYFPSTAKVLKSFDYKIGPWVHAFGYVALDNQSKEVIVAFRGTDTFVQLVEELIRSSMVDFINETGAKVNNYFQIANQDLHPHVTAALQELNRTCGDGGCHFYFTGHSLGGAMASLAAYRMAKEYEMVQRSVSIYTFGQPRVGNSVLAARIRELIPNHFRLVNGLDVVPHMPGCTSNSSGNGDKLCVPAEDGYYHAGTEIWFPKGDYKNGVMCAYRECVGAPVSEDNSCSDGVLNDVYPSQGDHHDYWGILPNGYCNPPPKSVEDEQIVAEI